MKRLRRRGGATRCQGKRRRCQREISHQGLGQWWGLSNTGLSAVRPKQLHLVGAEGLVLPSTDVTDLAIGVVVPPLAGNRVGNRLGELVGADGRQRVERRQVAEAPRAIRVWDDRVIQPAGGAVVIAAERLAG